MNKKVVMVMLASCLNIPLSGVSQGLPEIQGGLLIPPDSLASLQEFAQEIAETNHLKVKFFEFLLETAHPESKLEVRIHFQEQLLGDDVYEFSTITIANSNWHKLALYKDGSDRATMPPASTTWFVLRELNRCKKLKVELEDTEAFVVIGPNLNDDQVRLYLSEFIKWAKENPSLMEHSISDLSGIFTPVISPPEYENKSMIRFDFKKRTSGVGYNFEIIDARLIFADKNFWQR